MTEERRTMMLLIAEHHPAAPPYLYHLDRFRRCDEILRWLLKNKLTGMRFVQWVRNDHAGSILKAGADVLRRLDREAGPRAIIGGKDYLLS